jgi:uncharacterized phage protein gp47/JayE
VNVLPWTTPTLRQVREIVRDDITSALIGAAMVGNSVLRVVADANAGLAHLTLRYIDWLARQFLPDTAETEWLDRHGDIWLVNADGTTGRKSPSFSSGSVVFTGSDGTVLPAGTRLIGATTEYETIEQITVGVEPTPCRIVAVDPGEAGNLIAGEQLALVETIPGIDSAVTVITLDGGDDQETDEDLRTRVLLRIRNPPMGGDKTDYVQWALSYPGVTRAWCYPLEMGIGTVTVRFMMDDMRAGEEGFPTPADVASLAGYLDTVRPVAVKDFFVEAPIPYPIDFTISGLANDNESTRAAIELSVREMMLRRIEPGTIVYRSWIDEAISAAVGEDHHELTFTTLPMPSPGYMATLGTISYV